MLLYTLDFTAHSLYRVVHSYSPPQRSEGNKSSVFVDSSSCVAAVAHRNFYSEVVSPVFPVLFPTFSNLKFKASLEKSRSIPRAIQLNAVLALKEINCTCRIRRITCPQCSDVTGIIFHLTFFGTKGTGALSIT